MISKHWNVQNITSKIEETLEETLGTAAYTEIKKLQGWKTENNVFTFTQESQRIKEISQVFPLLQEKN